MRVWIGVSCIVFGLAIHQWQSLVALAISTREGG